MSFFSLLQYIIDGFQQDFCCSNVFSSE